MDFQDMDDEVMPDVNTEQIINDLTETDNSTTEESQTKLPPTTDNSTDQITNGSEGVAAPKLEAFATTSKSKQITVTSEMKNKGIQEFVRILRPHLTRKSKSKAYKMMQNIANGIMTDNTFQRSRVRQNKPKKRTVRKPKTRAKKSRVSGGVRKKIRSAFGSMDSSPSDTSCPRCGYTCCKVSRF